MFPEFRVPGIRDEARELVGFDEFANVGRWLQLGLKRPAVQRGLKIPS